jgi:hypothetical protein
VSFVSDNVSIVSFTVVRYVFDSQLFLRSAHQKSIAFVNNLIISVTLIVVAVPEGVVFSTRLSFIDVLLFQVYHWLSHLHLRFPQSV